MSQQTDIQPKWAVASYALQDAYTDFILSRQAMLCSPWENGFVESFNGKMRDEFLNGEIFYSLKEAEVLLEQWRIEYNPIRPHSALGYKPPAPKTVIEQKPISQPLGLTL